MHWSAQYIGRSWVSGARGPETFDCWGLLWWVYQKHLDIALPIYPAIDATNQMLVAKLIDLGAQGSEWTRIDTPEEGCAVALSAHRVFHHVGVFVDCDGGLVVHARSGAGVIAQSISQLKQAGYRRIEFYRHASARH